MSKQEVDLQTILSRTDDMTDKEFAARQFMKTAFLTVQDQKINIKVKPVLGVAPMQPYVIKIEDLVFEEVGKGLEEYKG